MARPIPRFTALGAVAFAVVLSGCGSPQVAQGINDPYEASNRKIHAFNLAVDKAILRPTANGYGDAIPKPLRQGVTNFAGHLDLPGSFVNDVLQANVEDASVNFLRFLVNSTFGIVGLLDPATEMGLPARTSDFGETLHVWGAGEGPYVELPLMGPSTQRDAAGKVVDLFTNPLNYVLDSPERYALPVAGAVSTLGDRATFGDTIDSILYDSADSYAQARLLYLERRRFQLGGTVAEGAADVYDDYEDFYGQ